MAVSLDQLRDLYHTCKTIQAFDGRLRRGLGAGEFRFSYWPVEGQEAISAGVCSALLPEDRMVITYRGAADAIAKGVPLAELAGELMGKSTGTSKGKGGAMGINAPDAGVMAATGIVGAGAPIANGIALASQMRNEGRVVVVSFGDGATSIGAVHEAMNLASLWQLPVVFLCHNNLFGEGTPQAEYTRTTQLSDRAAAYGMSGVTVDGTDAVAVHEAAKVATERARNGDGPTFLEAIAFRLNGHYFGDPCAYVDQAQLEAARANEPVGKLRKLLAQSGVSEPELEETDASIETEVETAVVSARDGSGPDAGELFVDVYEGRRETGAISSGRSESVEAAGETEDRSMAEAINRGLDEALAADESVVLLGEDIADPVGGLFTCTASLSSKYGRDRVRPTPIAEQAIIGAAVGAALAGMRPVAEIMFADFLGVCLDQIANHAAKLRYMSGGRASVPLTIRTMAGAHSGAQHSQSLEAWLMHVPGLKVVAPSNPADAKGLLTSCIEDDDPCVFIESMALLLARQQRGPVPVGRHRVPIGVANVVREGSDATVVSWGAMLHEAVGTADSLAESGRSIEVIDVRTLVPLDLETIVASVRKTRRLVIAHSAVEFCGPGAEIAALVGEACQNTLAAPITRVGAAFTPVPRAFELESGHLPNQASIRAAVERVLG